MIPRSPNSNKKEVMTKNLKRKIKERDKQMKKRNNKTKSKSKIHTSKTARQALHMK